jgi:hypothetical protein
MKMKTLVRFAACAAVFLAPLAASGATVIWDVSSGVLPDHNNPPFTLLDTAPTDPTLAGGALTLSTPVGGNDVLGYSQSGAQLDVPANLRIEARMRRVSGSSSEQNRAPGGITFAPAAGAVNFLWIDADAIFLNTPGDVRGPVASVDTDDAFHTYRIEVTGTAVGSPINVFYDNGAAPVLTGTLIPSAIGAAEIDWGDLSEAVGGVSEWQHFEHNAGAVPEPGGAVALAAGALVFCATRRTRVGRTR